MSFLILATCERFYTVSWYACKQKVPNIGFKECSFQRTGITHIRNFSDPSTTIIVPNRVVNKSRRFVVIKDAYLSIKN